MKTSLLTIVFTLSVILTSVAQAQTSVEPQSIPLTIDSTQSTISVDIGGAVGLSQLSGNADFEIGSSNPPSGAAQITDLNLVLDDSISASFALGLLTGSTQPGDVTISLVTPGEPGTIADDSFNQLGNSLAVGGELSVIDPFGLAGGNQTVDLSVIEVSPVDFNSVSVTQSGDVITVSSSFTFSEMLNLNVGPTPIVLSGTFVATGIVTDPLIPGDVNLDGAVDCSDISPFISAIITGEFVAEADINQSDSVNFFDIRPFVNVLMSQLAATN